MKVKRYYPEYKNWLTEKQWLSKGKVIIDMTKTVTLWSNQFCNVSSVYAAPDNVRDMTDSEKLSFREEMKLQRKLAKERQITRYELERARQEELDKATKLAEKLREDTVVSGLDIPDVKKVTDKFMDGYFQVPKVLGEGA